MMWSMQSVLRLGNCVMSKSLCLCLDNSFGIQAALEGETKYCYYYGTHKLWEDYSILAGMRMIFADLQNYLAQTSTCCWAINHWNPLKEAMPHAGTIVLAAKTSCTSALFIFQDGYIFHHMATLLLHEHRTYALLCLIWSGKLKEGSTKNGSVSSMEQNEDTFIPNAVSSPSIQLLNQISWEKL